MTTGTTEALPLRLLGRGKVRDIYEVDAARILLVASDRISAFDVVMRETIPFKGAVLTQLTAWWLEKARLGAIRHHMISADFDQIAADLPELESHRNALYGRAMLCRRATVFPVECVVRGYIAGSCWKEYVASGTLAGEPLPAGLRESQRLEPAVFSPATKASSGHDRNISLREMADSIGGRTATDLERLSRLVYERGSELAAARGIIIADTKLEFGTDADGNIMLVDEVLTPDSSRFWPAESYRAGQAQPSFDKQPLRDWLQAARLSGSWDGEPPPPQLPPEVVHATGARYLEAYRRITGTPLETSELS